MTTINNETLVVIYSRVSNPKQMKEGDGLQSQITLCTEYCVAKKYSIINQFEDGGISGKFSSREGINAMIEYLAQENKNYTKIQYVIVDDIDRIVRDVQGRRELKAKIEGRGGAKIISLKQDIDDSPEGKMIQSITMSVKQYERENNARRTKDRKRARIKNGYWNYGVVPGYKYIKNLDGGGKVLNPTEPGASIIKEGLELFAEGVIVNKKKLLEHFRSRGLESNYKNLIYSHSIDTMLTEDRLKFYAGIINFKKFDLENIPGKHKPLISIETVHKILQRLKPNTVLYKTYSEKDIAQKLPLRGIMKCCGCGKPVTGGPSKGCMGKTYFYYMCKQPNCILKDKNMNIDKVHALFQETLSKYQLRPELYQALEYVLQEVSDQEEQLKIDAQKTTNEKLKIIETDITKFKERLCEAKTDITLETYEKKLESLVQEKKELLLKQNISQDTTAPKILQTIQKLKKIVQRPAGAWELDNLELKRILLHTLFNGNVKFDIKSSLRTNETPLFYGCFDDFIGKNYYNQGEPGSNGRQRCRKPLCSQLHYPLILFFDNFCFSEGSGKPSKSSGANTF